MTVYRMFLFATAAMAAAPALAADAPGDGGMIVVTGRGLEDAPAAPAYDVTVLERKAIVSSASGRIEDVLTSVAGFQQFRRSDSRSSNPSAQGVTLRSLGGNATSRALVLLDGVPMADPFFGYIPLSALAPERLSRIAVTRGGGSGPFGTGALAGVIELESADAATLGLLNGSALVSQRGETELSGTIAPQLGSGFAVLSGRWDRGEGFYTTPQNQRVPASVRAGYDNWSIGGRVVLPLSGTVELQARALGFDDHRTLRFDGADSTSSGQDASLRLVGRGDWQFDALAFVQSRNFSNVVVSSTRFVPVLDQRKTPSTGIGGKFELRPPLGENHVFKIGADFRRASGTMYEDAYSAFTGAKTARRKAGGRNSDLGLFVEDDWTLGHLILTGGVRADRTSIKGGYYTERTPDGLLVSDSRFDDRSSWDVTWRGGALFHLSPSVTLRGAGYSGIRLPTLNELYRPFVVFPVTTEANAALENEKLEGYEAGIAFTPAEGMTFSATAFDNRVKNAIANVTIGENLRQRRNLPAIKARGVELGASIERGKVRFDGSLAWTNAKVRGRNASEELDGKRPAQTPEWAMSGTVSYAPSEGWLLSATLRHVGKQYESDLETDVLPAATTFDAFAQVPLADHFSVILRAENLFDETIVTRNSGGSIDLGAPRTLWAGVRWTG
ncbi:TonB-dependent receptor [Croceicoccus estronivorus]|uniref:TonB-dependent receptor n=1 Tax=Croceicoccus estronivorus TaxID=1172626 RepID=UPI000829C8E8|nr:TonB-dependent receptor [Croceicoccus estronivorus]OCC25391.1 TonB-dependent receptor [Croceicoccus estronivorus]